MFFFLQIRLILVFGTIAGLLVCIFLAIVSKLVWASTMCWYSYGPWIEQAYSGSFCYNYTMYFGMFSCLLFIHFLLSVTSFFFFSVISQEMIVWSEIVCLTIPQTLLFTPPPACCIQHIDISERGLYLSQTQNKTIYHVDSKWRSPSFRNAQFKD